MLLAHVAEQDVLQELVCTFSSPKHVVLHVLCAVVVLSHVLKTCGVFYIAAPYSMQSLIEWKQEYVYSTTCYIYGYNFY